MREPVKENAKDCIRITNIPQGALVLILNKERPTKSGWWRKVREKVYTGKYSNCETLFVLEKPVHKDFEPDDPNLSETHKEDGFFVMTTTTLKDGVATGKYSILCCLCGTTSVRFALNSFNMGALPTWNTENIDYTDDFVNFYNIVMFGNATKPLVQLIAENYQVWR